MPLIASHHITVIRFYRAAVILLCISLHLVCKRLDTDDNAYYEMLSRYLANPVRTCTAMSRQYLMNSVDI